MEAKRKWWMLESTPIETTTTWSEGQEPTRHHPIEMLKSEETSFVSVCTIHTSDRQMWSLRIVKGRPQLRKVRKGSFKVKLPRFNAGSPSNIQG